MSTGVIFILGKGVSPILASGVKSTWPQGSSEPGFSIHHSFSYIAGVFITGLGYGVIQPIIYDKTSYVAPNAAKSTEYFAYLLTCNYVGISCVPFIVGAMKRLFDAQSDPNFSFIFNGFICVLVLIVAIIKRKSFVFEADANSYEHPTPTPSSTKQS